MPRYDYRCKMCGATVEVAHGFTDDPVVECEDCEAAMLRQIGVPRVMPSAFPTRGEGGSVSHKNSYERTLAKDLDAYKRARVAGDQPEGIDGQAQREATAESHAEYVGAV